MLAAISLLALGVWKQRDAFLSPSLAPLRYGQPIEPTTLRDGTVSVTLGSGRWDVILIDVSGNGLQLSSYLQFLLDSGRYVRSAINPILLVQNDTAGPVRDERRRRVSLPVVPIEAHESEFIRHGFLFDDERVVFINPQRRVAFVASFARPNDLRLLFEKFIPRTQSAVELRSAPLAAGDEMPKISLKPLNAPTAAHAGGPATWVVFGGKCSACVLSSYTQRFASHENALLQQANVSGTAVYLVFSSLLSTLDLQRRLKELHVRSTAFIAGGPIGGVEGDYSREPLSDSDVVVITTNAQNRVVHVDSFEAYLSAMGRQR
ncbi:MAG TPA: hypothetical protein VLC46_04025 [Thermoanaerobaculia bacterium]|nr:hypothetical protein [Thermoanaerobaculia bacterium]